MLIRRSETKLKMFERNISFKYKVWYKKFNEEGEYVCYCTSNVFMRLEQQIQGVKLCCILFHRESCLH